MAGKPKQTALAKWIERAGGDAVIFDRMLAGESIQSIADSFDVSPRMIYHWRDETDERRAEWDRTRELSAETLVEEGKGILDKARADSTAEVKLASERANYRRWMASMWDRKQFGEAKETQVVNIAELHLNALRKYGGPQNLKGVEEARVLSEESVERALPRPTGPGGPGEMVNPHGEASDDR